MKRTLTKLSQTALFVESTMNVLVLSVVLVVCVVGLSSAQSGRQDSGSGPPEEEPPPPPGGPDEPLDEPEEPPGGPDESHDGPGGPHGGPGHHGGPGGHHGGPGHQGGPGHHSGPGPHGGPGGRRHGPPPPPIMHMFPSCDAMNDAIRQKHNEMWKSKQIGPKANNCQEKVPKDCMRKDMNTVRCAVTVKPSQECVQDMMKYLQGSSCDTPGQGTESSDSNSKVTESSDSNSKVTESSEQQELETTQKQ